MLIPALAVGDFAITLVAVMVAVYELALLFMRGALHGHGWAAGLALGAAVYSASTGVQYIDGGWSSMACKAQVPYRR